MESNDKMSLLKLAEWLDIISVNRSIPDVAAAERFREEVEAVAKAMLKRIGKLRAGFDEHLGIAEVDDE